MKTEPKPNRRGNSRTVTTLSLILKVKMCLCLILKSPPFVHWPVATLPKSRDRRENSVVNMLISDVVVILSSVGAMLQPLWLCGDDEDRWLACLYSIVVSTCRMSMKLNVSSGSYNVRESELYKEARSPGKLMRCRVHFLDDSEGNFEIDVWHYFLSLYCNCLVHYRSL